MERGVLNTIRDNYELELINVSEVFGAGSVKSGNVKVVEGGGKVVLNANESLDVWLSDCVKDCTLNCKEKLKFNFSDKLSASVELDSDGKESEAAINYISKRVGHLNVEKIQKEIPNVFRRFQIKMIPTENGNNE